MGMFKMNEEQKRLFDILKPLQREISLNSIAGMNDIDSYKASSGKAKKENTMRASVSEILTNPNVTAFLDSMKSMAVNDAIMTRAEMLEQLTKLAKLSGEELEKGVGALTELKGGFDVKMKAMDMISKIEGFEAATKYDHTSSDGSMSPDKEMTDEDFKDKLDALGFDLG